MTPSSAASAGYIYTLAPTPTPQHPLHALHTPTNFLHGFPPDDPPPAYPPHPPSYPPTPPQGACRFSYSYPSSSTPDYPATYHLLPHKTHLWPPHPHPQPTTPTMAISLRHSATTSTAPSSASDSPPTVPHDPDRPDPNAEPTTPPPAARPKDASKKKIHPCWMCHKRFDRPSTLKKHLLVHTGEKAFACDSCGRRFGVASNLNRHAKTCRAAHASASANAASASPAPSARAASDASPSIAPANANTSTSTSTSTSTPARRKRRASQDDPASPPPATTTTPTTTPTTTARPTTTTTTTTTTPTPTAPDPRPRPRKRARRAPSPSDWVPDSLRLFDLTPLTKGTPVPLPPVRPFNDTYNHEERDSFDENTSPTPYHPQGWRGRLPGPGLLGQNVANRSGGQILIF